VWALVFVHGQLLVTVTRRDSMFFSKHECAACLAGTLTAAPGNVPPVHQKVKAAQELPDATVHFLSQGEAEIAATRIKVANSSTSTLHSGPSSGTHCML
jgi:hypothetical protein